MVVDCRVSTDGYLELYHQEGCIVEEDDEDDSLMDVLKQYYQRACLDFMVRSYALDMATPAPLPPHIATAAREDPMRAAQWCFSFFGRDAVFATPLSGEGMLDNLPTPTKKMYSISLLHISIVSGDTLASMEQLKKGVPPDLLSEDGAPMHWTTQIRDPGRFEAMVNALCVHGAQVDVRAKDGDTALGKLVQRQDLPPEDMIARLDFLKLRGADVNALQSKGFTALHRAAEMGRLEIVDWLLKAGAKVDVDAMGYTPLRLAQMQGNTEIIVLLEEHLQPEEQDQQEN